MKSIKNTKYNILLLSLIDFKKEVQFSQNYLSSVGYRCEYFLIKEIALKKRLKSGFDQVEYSNKTTNMGFLKDEFALIQGSDVLVVLNYDMGLKKAYISSQMEVYIKFVYVLGKRLFILNNLDKRSDNFIETSVLKPISLRGNLSNIENYLY